MKGRIAWLGVTAVWLALLPGFLFMGQAVTTATPTAVNVTPIPTRDRLAAPPTVAAPTQADEGAQLYWLHCQPCHGDEGQGLTDEWRAQYPPEDQYCWNSGCHGKRPNEAAFTLPTAVPAVIGANTLTRFHSLGQLYRFIQATMPYQAPGSLTEEEYLALTAFLSHAHGRDDSLRLNPDDMVDNSLTPEPAPLVEQEAGAVNWFWRSALFLGVVMVLTAVVTAVIRLARVRK
jgi:cytochrome c